MGKHHTPDPAASNAADDVEGCSTGPRPERAQSRVERKPVAGIVLSDDFDEDSIPTTLFEEEASSARHATRVGQEASSEPAAESAQTPRSVPPSVHFSDDFEQEIATQLRSESYGAAEILVQDDFEEHILTRLAQDTELASEPAPLIESPQPDEAAPEHTQTLGADELDALAVGEPTDLPDRKVSADVAHMLGREFGGFRIVRKIAEGGMASVFLARKKGPRAFNQHAAVKIVHPHLSSQKAFIEMFLDEARIAALVQHPNVCRVLDFGHANGTYYLAMEYVHGEPWGELLNALLEHPEGREQLPLIAAHVVAQACEGLHAAHETTDENGKPLSIVHRDISPQNIFIAYDGTVRVLDFGVASAADRLTTTRTGTVKGRLSYMAPEQMRSETVDPRADVWSLGVVLREALEGRRLFRRGSEAETMLAVASDPLPEWLRGIPGPLRLVADQALERDRDQRFASARDMGGELSRYVGGQAQALDSAELSGWLTRLFSKRIDRKKRWLKQAIPDPDPGLYNDEHSSSDGMYAGDPYADAGSSPSGQRGLTPEEIWAGRVSEPPPGLVPRVPHDPTLKLKAAVARRTFPVMAWLSLAVAAAALMAVAGAWYQRHQALKADGQASSAALQAPREVSVASGDGADLVEAPPVSYVPHTEPMAVAPDGPAEPAEARAEQADGTASPGHLREPAAPRQHAGEEADEQAALRRAERKERRRRARESRAAAEVETQAKPVQPGPPGKVTVAFVGGWADVFFEGEKLGTTPGRFELPTGTHTLVLKPFGAGPELRERVRVPPGGTVKLRVEL